MSNGDPRSGSSLLARCLVALVAVSLFVVLAWSGSADAGLGASAAPIFPGVVTVGNTGLPASIQLRNNNSAPNTSDTNIVCNAGDPVPCPAGEPGITLIPSCGLLGIDSVCKPAGADPGVFQVSPTAVGKVGTACAGMNFDIKLIDPVYGRLRFIPVNGGHVVLSGFGSMCELTFTVDVLKAATVDQNPGVPGLQTVQVVDNTQYVVGLSNTASGRGTSIGTTVARATPTISTSASANIAIGGGTLSDSVTVSGRVNAQAGATVDLRVYGPNDTTCSGQPAFESLGVSYPAAGGPVTSAPFTPTLAGDYRWVASYSGDANNNPVSGACNDANEITLVTQGVPTIATSASASITLGEGVLVDLAIVSGRVNPQPGATVGFRLYGPNDATCSGAPVFTSLGVDYPVAGGQVMSTTFAPILAGDYRWVASYSGDANNVPVSGACNDANEIVTVFVRLSAPPTPTPQGSILPATGSRTGTLLFAAFGLMFVGCILVVSTFGRRRHSFVRSRR